jgi:hypothetical protein
MLKHGPLPRRYSTNSAVTILPGTQRGQRKASTARNRVVEIAGPRVRQTPDKGYLVPKPPSRQGTLSVTVFNIMLKVMISEHTRKQEPNGSKQWELCVDGWVAMPRLGYRKGEVLQQVIISTNSLWLAWQEGTTRGMLQAAQKIKRMFRKPRLIALMFFQVLCRIQHVCAAHF